jgi:hypothetical protein
MGLKSLAAGYLNDAIRYLRIAHENDPNDGEVMLKLGSAYNIAKNDREAIYWFGQARHSSDDRVAKEADQAWHNLAGSSPPRTVLWTLPMYSSRWNDGFIYGQFKFNLFRLNRIPVQFYLSSRFMGDARGRVTGANVPAQYLSENSVIVGAGIATRQWHHLTGWAEAGESISYLRDRTDVGTAIPDYRGGVNFARGYGALLGAKRTGAFYETTGDAVYVSRFDKDWLFYSQHRIGRTFNFVNKDFLQLYANVNYVRDMKNQYWANTVEFGPGVRMHVPGMLPGVYLSADWLRGVYTVNQDNPRRPNYNDFRLSFWYAANR